MSLISVIIPTHNRSDLLAKTLENVLQSKNIDLEIIVVDDGSSDDSSEVAAKFPNTQVIRFDPARGACSARNAGYKACKGEFVMFLDSDDLVHPEKLSRQQQALEEDSNLDGVVCQSAFFQEDPNQVEILWNTFTGLEPTLRFLRHDPAWGTHAVLWRKASLEKAGLLWDESLPLAQDLDFHVRALLAGLKLKMVPELLAFVRIHSGPTIGTTKDSLRGKTLLELYKQYYRQVQPGTAYYRAIRGTFYWLAIYGATVRDKTLMEDALAMVNPRSIFAYLCRKLQATGLGRWRKLAVLVAKIQGHDVEARANWHHAYRVENEPNLVRFERF